MIADTSFLVGVANERDAHHAAAKALLDEEDTFVLHEYVFAETVTVVAGRCGHDAAVAFGRWLLEDERFVWAAAIGIVGAAWKRFTDHPGLSLVDAALVELATTRGQKIATYDRRLAATLQA